MTIEIADLEFHAIIGILDFEREAPQRVSVTCKIKYNYTKGAYIDYADVAAYIKEMTMKEQFLLLEDALEHVSSKLKKRFSLIQKLKLSYTKPDILDDCRVSLSQTYSF